MVRSLHSIRIYIMDIYIYVYISIYYGILWYIIGIYWYMIYYQCWVYIDRYMIYYQWCVYIYILHNHHRFKGGGRTQNASYMFKVFLRGALKM